VTGWFAGPKADARAIGGKRVGRKMGLAPLAEIFGPPLDRLRLELVAARAINWDEDVLARGTYS